MSSPISVLLALSQETRRSFKTKVTGLMHLVVCPFTRLLLINRPWRDSTVSWCWYTVAAGEIWTSDLAITRNYTVASAPFAKLLFIIIILTQTEQVRISGRFRGSEPAPDLHDAARRSRFPDTLRLTKYESKKNTRYLFITLKNL